MQQLGWSEGANIEYLERMARPPAFDAEPLVRDLVDAHVDAMFLDDFAVAPALKLTRSIPIVCPNIWDPVGQGFASSFARPDRNVTGISWQSLESTTKRVQLARDIVRDLRRAAVLVDRSDPDTNLEAERISASAQRLSIATTVVGLKDAASAGLAVEEVRKARAQVLFVSVNALTWQARAEIVRAATAARVPVVTEVDFAREGGVLSYGPDTAGAIRRGAYFVDRLLRGTAVADLPFEQPNAFYLVVNLKAAHALGIAIPEPILQAATKVVQ